MRLAWDLLRGAIPFLAALIAVLAAILGFTTTSASAVAAPETRVGAVNLVGEVVVGSPQHVSAGQRLGEAADRVVTAEATGVAAKAAGEGADDWPIISGIVRDAGQSKATLVSERARCRRRIAPGNPGSGKAPIGRVAARR
jgi:hypothetical protein